MSQINPKYRQWEKVAGSYNRKNLKEVYQSYLDIFAGEPAPIIWKPSNETINNSNLKRSLDKLDLDNYGEFFQWASKHRAEYWQYATETLGIKFSKPCDKVLDLTDGIENPRWFKGASLNIVESCFQGRPEQTALLEGNEGTGRLESLTYKELREKVEKVAGGLNELGYKAG